MFILKLVTVLFALVGVGLILGVVAGYVLSLADNDRGNKKK